MVVAGGMMLIVAGVLKRFEDGSQKLEALPAMEEAPSDVHQIGELLFTTYWFPVQITGLLLLVATVGVVVLSRREIR